MSRSMKNSGVAWIGEVPSNWCIDRIKNVARQHEEKYVSGDYDYIALENVESMTSRYIQTASEYSLEGSKIANKGDIIFGKLRPYLRKVMEIEKTVCVSNEFIVFDTKLVTSNFFKYYLLSDGFISAVNSSTYGAKMPRANANFVENCPIVFPQMNVQEEITKFIDKKCLEIDVLIDNQKKQIERLKHYGQSLITEVVTKGLDSDAQMKDSGVDWIKKIPKHWDVCKTLYCLDMPITDGPHTTPELHDEGIPFISAEAVSCGNGSIDFSHMRGYISQEFYDECCKKYIPQIDDIYMIKSGATTGRVSIVDTEETFTIWSPLAVFRCNQQRMMPRFMFYFLQSYPYQKQVELGWSYGTQQNIGMRVLEKLKVFVPPLDEQKKMVDYLDLKYYQVNELIKIKQKKIEKLNQYKKSIIYEYVTGKKEA